MAPPWIRCYVKDLHDPVLNTLPPKDYRDFHRLRLIAGMNDPRGILPPVADIAYQLRCSPIAAQRLLDRFLANGLLDKFPGCVLMPRGWDTEQFVSDDTTKRTREFKERKKQEAEGNVPGNGLERDIEDIRKERERGERARRPSLCFAFGRRRSRPEKYSGLDDVIGWNAYTEMTGYWWPTVASQYVAEAPTGNRKSHCSAFIATGAATADGGIVIGHQTFTEFWDGQFMNVILDITPADGQRIVMQTSPGWIASMTDFWVTGGGLVVNETTMAGFKGYDVTKVPEYVRARHACQYATSIDEWIELMDTQNNGGYANMWLLGDIKTGEIADYEQGLIYQRIEKKTDGWFFGENAPDDPRIRNIECSDTRYNDIRFQTGSRRVRWPQLLGQYEGRIDAEIGQTMLGDTFDPYLGYINPSSRTICSHYDEDPMAYFSDPAYWWNVPFYPAGSVDAKVTTAAAAEEMRLWARFGRADGAPFDAEEFLRLHPQYTWQEGYLRSRPSQPWTLFEGRSSRS